MKPTTILFTALALMALVACSKKEIGPDTTAPQISIIGNDSVYVLKGASGADPGALASDDRDGELNVSIVSNWDSIMKLGELGKKIITYRVTDKAGNTASTSRIVYIDFTGKMPLGVFTTSIEYIYSCPGRFSTSSTSTLAATAFKDQFKLTVRDSIRYTVAYAYSEYTLTALTNDLTKLSVSSKNKGNMNNYGGSANFDPVSSTLNVSYGYTNRQSSINCSWQTTMQLQQFK